ncbi:glycosyltransferase family 8 protein [Acetivibrio straminisolvens]|uniref:glycosyltransferase family 8 protein n=1 Tax=Acetivibrio straminisolvens TaxID=253314 RepID=UPI00223FA27C|nr:glycosyltransferase family 8 protein [Acetivibrio straminisolvens]
MTRIGNSKSILNFVLSSDENYADKLAVTMYSILEVHAEVDEVCIHVLSNNILKTSIEKIKTIEDKFSNAKIIVHNLDDLGEKLGKDVNVDHLSLATYARLLIPDILPDDVDKALYLDVDILVRENLSDLFSMAIEDYYVAGVKSIIDLADCNEDEEHYFHINAGVMLWNLKKCREEKFVQKCLDYIRNTNGKIKFHDQTIINEVCKGKIKALHPRYNVMSGMFFLKYSKFISVYGLKNYYSKKEFDDAVSSPAIIHLTSWVVGRPWEEGCVHPYKGEYERILQLTPWRGKPLLRKRRRGYKLVIYRLLPGSLIRIITKIKRLIKAKIK